MALEIVYRRLDELRSAPRNARLHSAAQVAQIAASIKEWGATNPILIDEHGEIIAGHGRKSGAELAGLAQFPTITLAGLTKAQKRAYLLADNVIPLGAEWDLDVLRSEMIALADESFDLGLIGFGDAELDDLLGDRPGDTDPDATPPVEEAAVSRLGDVWLLGDHRLLCGDCTDAESVARAMGSARPHLLVSDPPYGVEYDANWRNETGIAEDGSLQRVKTGRVRRVIGAKAVGPSHNDDRADWSEAWKLFPGDVVYAWHAGRRASDADLSLRAAGFEVRAQIVWDKERMIIGRGDYHWAHEPCWYCVRKGRRGHWAGGRQQTTIWRIPHHASETGHSAQKPVECMKRPIENSSRRGDAVYDPFVGSGTTIIAAEMTGRRCIAIEVHPQYCDLAVRRWQDFAGAEAYLEGDGRPFAALAAERLDIGLASVGKGRKTSGRAF